MGDSDYELTEVELLEEDEDELPIKKRKYKKRCKPSSLNKKAPDTVSEPQAISEKTDQGILHEDVYDTNSSNPNVHPIIDGKYFKVLSSHTVITKNRFSRDVEKIRVMCECQLCKIRMTITPHSYSNLSRHVKRAHDDVYSNFTAYLDIKRRKRAIDQILAQEDAYHNEVAIQNGEDYAVTKVDIPDIKIKQEIENYTSRRIESNTEQGKNRSWKYDLFEFVKPNLADSTQTGSISADEDFHSSIRPSTSENSAFLAQYLAEKKKRQHPIDIFFKSMAAEVKQLPVQQQIKIKQDVLQMISNAQLAALQDETEVVFS